MYREELENDMAMSPPSMLVGGADPDSNEENCAFIEELMRSYNDILKGFFMRRLPTRQDTEDLMQETYSRIANSDVSVIRDPKAFLFKIANNLILDEFRRGRLNANKELLPFEEEDHVSEIPSLDRVVSGKQAMDVFEDLLDELPPKRKQVFVLQRFKGMSYTQIADFCGISESTVKDHMGRAIAHFMEKM